MVGKRLGVNSRYKRQFPAMFSVSLDAENIDPDVRALTQPQAADNSISTQNS